jgi:hypothetical protein
MLRVRWQTLLRELSMRGLLQAPSEKRTRAAGISVLLQHFGLPPLTPGEAFRVAAQTKQKMPSVAMGGTAAGALPAPAAKRARAAPDVVAIDDYDDDALADISSGSSGDEGARPVKRRAVAAGPTGRAAGIAGGAARGGAGGASGPGVGDAPEATPARTPPDAPCLLLVAPPVGARVHFAAGESGVSGGDVADVVPRLRFHATPISELLLLPPKAGGSCRAASGSDSQETFETRMAAAAVYELLFRDCAAVVAASFSACAPGAMATPDAAARAERIVAFRFFDAAATGAITVGDLRTIFLRSGLQLSQRGLCALLDAVTGAASYSDDDIVAYDGLLG